MRPASVLICSFAGIAASVLLSALPAQAQAQDMLFRCTFDWVCDPNRKCQDAQLDIRFKLNSETNQASRIGATGPGTTNVIIGDRAATFVETPISGGVSTTTVKLSDGEAVHSSHAIDGTTLSPMQYLGNCVVY
jgi:hypothetical protein